MEKSTFIEKYKTIYRRTEELLSEKFGDVMENEDIQEMNKAILDLYEQVTCFISERKPFLARQF